MAQEVTGAQVVQNPKPLHRLHNIKDWSDFAYIESILRDFPEEVSVVDEKGNFPLHHAARFAEPTLLKRMLDAYPKGKLATNNFGYTTLHLAIGSYCGGCGELDSFIVERCQMLINKEVINVRARSGNTALQMAIVNNCPPELVRLLLYYGADIGQVRLDGSLVEIPEWVFNCFEPDFSYDCPSSVCSYGCNSLHLTVERGHVGCVINWMRVYPTFAISMRSFSNACELGHAATIQLILLKRPPSDVIKQEGLRAAVTSEQKAVARILIRHGTKLEKLDGVCATTWPQWVIDLAFENQRAKVQKPLHRLHSITDWKNVTYIDSILKEFPEEVSVVDDEGNLPLHHAARFAEPTLLKRILDAYPEAAFKVNSDQNTPLHVAIDSFERTSIAPHLVNAFTQRCMMLLEAANGRKGFGDYVNLRNNDGHTPLRLAMKDVQCSQVVQLLIQRGADLCQVHLDDSLSEIPEWVLKCLDPRWQFACSAGTCSWSSLYQAVERGHFGCVWNWMRNNPSAYIQTETFRLACFLNRIAIVQIILSRRNVSEEAMQGGLFSAIERGNKTIVRILLRHGAIFGKLDSVSATTWPQWVLDLVAENQRAEETTTQQSLRNLLNIADWSNMTTIESIIMENPDQASVIGSNGNLPLHFAARFAEPTVLKRILDAYPKGIFRKNNDGYNPLHLAIASYRGSALQPDPNDVHIEERCKMLLDVSIIESITEKGDTPLRLAIEHQVIAVVSLLLQHGADLSRVRLDDSPSAFLSEVPDWVFDCLDRNSVVECKKTYAVNCRPGFLNHSTCAWKWICENPTSCVPADMFCRACSMNQIAIVQISLFTKSVRNIDMVKGLEFAITCDHRVVARVIMKHLPAHYMSELFSIISPDITIPTWVREMAKACPGLSLGLKQDAGKDSTMPLEVPVNFPQSAIEITSQQSPSDPLEKKACDLCKSRGLRHAIVVNHMDCFTSLLKTGVFNTQIHERDGLGDTLLHMAARCRVLCVKPLLDAGVCVDTKNNYSHTPIVDAIKCKEPEAVRILLEHGASLENIGNSVIIPEWVISMQNEIRMRKNIRAAVQSDYATNAPAEAANTTLDNSKVEKKAEIQSLDSDIAALETPPQACKYCKAGSSLNLNHSSCFVALVKGHPDLKKCDDFGNTILHRAAQKNWELITPLLNAGVEVDPKNAHGMTPLFYATHYGHVKTSRLLMERGASLGNYPRGYTVPVWAHDLSLEIKDQKLTRSHDSEEKKIDTTKSLVNDNAVEPTTAQVATVDVNRAAKLAAFHEKGREELMRYWCDRIDTALRKAAFEDHADYVQLEIRGKELRNVIVNIYQAAGFYAYNNNEKMRITLNFFDEEKK